MLAHRMYLGALAALAMSLTTARPAHAWPEGMPEAAQRADFARALGLDPGTVVEVHPFDLDPEDVPRAKAVPGFMLGRFAERDHRQGYPALVVYVPCQRQLCLARVFLGPAATRIVSATLVDLDAPVSALEHPVDGSLALRRRPPTSPPTKPLAWPVLAVVLARDQGSKPIEVRTDLVLVSLRAPVPKTPKRPRGAPTPTMPQVLFEAPVDAHPITEAARHDNAPIPGNIRIGTYVTRLAFAHLGADVHLLTVTSYAVLPRDSYCSAPHAEAQTYILIQGRFQPIPAPPRTDGLTCP